MSYQINYTDSIDKAPIIVQDNQIDNSTSLSFPGRDITGYGSIIGGDLLHLLENFANSTPPSNPIQGQLWFNSSNSISQLLIYDGNTWSYVNGLNTGPTPPISNIAGTLWVNTTTDQLFLYSGSTWILVGPQTSSVNQTGAIAETIIDTNNNTQTVVSQYISGIRVLILSIVTFTPKSLIPGFTLVNQGLTFNSSYSTLNALNVNTSSLIVSNSIGGAAFTSYFSSPPAIGSISPSTGKFTTLTANSITGTGFTNYFSSPPAIGNTTPSTINGTTITGNTITGDTITASSSFVGNLTGNVTGSISGNAANITGGLSNQILYQSSSNTTSFITAPSSSNTYLQWNGSAFVWASNTTSLSNLTIGNGLSGSSYNGSSNVTIAISTPNNTTTATYYPIFSTTQGTSSILGTTSNITLNPGTGVLTTEGISSNYIYATSGIFSGPILLKSPTIVSTSFYTQLNTDSTLIITYYGTTVLTLLTAASYPGQILYIKLGTSGVTTVNSATSNIVPLNSVIAGTSILTSTNKYAMLQSDGTNWQVLMLV